MDQNIRIIHHQPLAGHGTFRGHRRDFRGLPDSFADATVDGLEMRLRSSRADDKKVGEGRDSAQVQDDDVLGLLVFG
jgi:hypothetical protein